MARKKDRSRPWQPVARPQPHRREPSPRGPRGALSWRWFAAGHGVERRERRRLARRRPRSFRCRETSAAGTEPVSGRSRRSGTTSTRPSRRRKKSLQQHNRADGQAPRSYKGCLKQLKEGAEKAVGKPVPFAVETQLNDAVQSLRDICSSYDGVWRSCIAPPLRGDVFEGPYEQLFGHLQEEPGSRVNRSRGTSGLLTGGSAV